jgi:predicted transcriptional regulator
MDANIVSFILRSKNRKKILELLKDHPKTPTQLFKDINMYETHIYRAIRELKNKELVEEKNPKDNIYKFYKTSKLGREVLKEVNKIKKDIAFHKKK